MTQIAFVGLGNMGAPMAANLLKAGHRLAVFDLVPAAVAKLEAAGARAAKSSAEAVAGAQVVFSMLPAGQHVKSLYLGDGGLLEAVGLDTLLVDCCTIDSESARELAEAAARSGLEMLDAPVSGGVAGAEAGTLTFIVGGAAAALERARPFLETMGKKIFHAGGAGAGQAAKMCNNMLLGILMTGTAEALNRGVANGLDPQVLSEIMKASSGNNWALQVYNPYPGVMDNVPASRGYQGGFGVDLIVKDLELALKAGLASRTALPLGALVRQLYVAHSKQGAGRLDFSSIIQFLEPERRGHD
jgi:3-hydroxyisobutyrate dehydrogenase